MQETASSSYDNWAESAQAQQIIDSGLAPGHGHEAAIVATLAPCSYTAIMRGVGNTTGIGVVEVYDWRDTTEAANEGKCDTAGQRQGIGHSRDPRPATHRNRRSAPSFSRQYSEMVPKVREH